jgi:hypothetical protein
MSPTPFSSFFLCFSDWSQAFCPGQPQTLVFLPRTPA